MKGRPFDPAPGRRAAKQSSKLEAAKRINARIVNCRDVGQLLDVVDSAGADFNYVNTSTALVRLAWILPSLPSALVGGLRSEWPSVPPFGSDGTASGAGVAGHNGASEPSAPGGFEVEPDITSELLPALHASMATLIERVSATMDDMTAWELSNVLWALSKVRFYDASLCQRLLQRLECLQAQIAPQAISNVLWSLANMPAVSTTPLGASTARLLADILGRTRGALQAQGVANTAWALFRLGLLSPSLSAQLARRAEAVRGDFKPMELSMWLIVLVQSGLHEHGVPHMRAMEADALAIVSRMSIREAAFTQTMVSLTWAYCAAPLESPAVLHAAMCRMPEWLRAGLPAESVPELLWAMASMGHYDEPCLRQLLAILYADLRRGGPLTVQEPSAWLWALAKLNVPLAPADAELVTSATLRYFQDAHYDSAASLKHIVQSVWALSVKGIFDEELRALARRRIDGLCAEFVRTEEQVESARTALHQIVFAEVYYHCRPGRGAAPVVANLPALLQADSILPPAMQETAFALTRETVRTQAAQPPSNFQRAVFEVLQGLGTNPVMEYVTADGFHAIDIALRTKAGVRIAVEVDGPSHFSVTKPHKITGETMALRRTLVALGWVVISVPMFAWARLRTPEARRQWLHHALVHACKSSPAPAAPRAPAQAL